VEAQLLEEIRDEIKAGNAKTPLGFGHPPKPRYVYANRQYPDALWYFWIGADNKHEPIEHHALTGEIVKLDIETKEFRGKPDPKVNLTVKADRTYIIQAGFDTLFAKGLLYSLASNKMPNFDGLWTIAVEPGETEQVLFCRIYDPVTGESVYAPYPDDVDWPAVAAKAQAKLGQPASAPEALPAATPKAKPVGKPAVKAVEPAAVEDDEITGEWSIEDAPEFDRADLMAESSKLAKAMGWNGQRAKQFITEEFPGCESRDDLNDDQLLALVTEWQSLAKVAA
jgi:hypothetical protein